MNYIDGLIKKDFEDKINYPKKTFSKSSTNSKYYTQLSIETSCTLKSKSSEYYTPSRKY